MDVVINSKKKKFIICLGWDGSVVASVAAITAQFIQLRIFNLYLRSANYM